MNNTTSLGALPGHHCTNFQSTIHCSWKGGASCTVLFFYLDDPGDPEVPEGCVRNLISLEFDFVIYNTDDAKVLAEEVWDRYREEILAGDGSRLYVTEDQNTIRLTAEIAEKVFFMIENPPEPSAALEAAVRAYRERLN